MMNARIARTIFHHKRVTQTSKLTSHCKLLQGNSIHIHNARPLHNSNINININTNTNINVINANTNTTSRYFSSESGSDSDSDILNAPRESMPFDVLIVGGGPSGLAASIRLKQLCLEHDFDLSVCVMEKGR